MWLSKLGFLLLSLSLSGVAAANEKNFISLGSSGSLTYYVSSGNLNHRLGSAVWIKVISFDKNAEWNYSFDTVMGCKGDWVVRPIRTNSSREATLLGQFKDSERRAFSQPEHAVSMNASPRLPEAALAKLKSSAKTLCASARPEEPKGKAFPLTETDYDEERGGSIYSLVLKSMKRNKSGTIEAWVKRADYRMVPYLDSNGVQVVIEGTPMTVQNFENSGSSMARRVFDCKNETSGVSSLTDYDSKGLVKDQFDTKGDFEMSAVLPDTIAEGMLEWMCRLYAK